MEMHLQSHLQSSALPLTPPGLCKILMPTLSSAAQQAMKVDTHLEREQILIHF